MGPTFIMFAVISELRIFRQISWSKRWEDKVYTRSCLKDIHSHKHRLDRIVSSPYKTF
jgi:hypothetical protein